MEKVVQDNPGAPARPAQRRRLLHRRSEVLPPPLVGQEEADCIARLMAGDPAARDTLVEHNLRLVVYIARKLRTPVWASRT